jgi:hypothetical protein
MSDVDYEIETLNDIIDYLENAIDGLNEVYEYQLAADIQYSKEEVEKKLRYFLDIEAKNQMIEHEIMNREFERNS